jgi:hypothetical protein
MTRHPCRSKTSRTVNHRSAGLTPASPRPSSRQPVRHAPRGRRRPVGYGVSWCGTGRRRRRPRPAAAVERDEAEADLQWVAAQGERVDADDQWRGGHPVAGAEDDPARQDVVVACRVIEERVTRSLSSSEPVSRFARSARWGARFRCTSVRSRPSFRAAAAARPGRRARRPGTALCPPLGRLRLGGPMRPLSRHRAGRRHAVRGVEPRHERLGGRAGCAISVTGSAAAAPAGSESAVTATTVESAPGAEAGARSTAVLRFAGRSTSAD